jgi:thiol-disulfide isomerase/thioredoxin
MALGLAVALAVLAAASVLGLELRRRTGRWRAVGGQTLTESELAAPLGRRATLVQFSSAFCAPCRATRQVLSSVADTLDGVHHVEVDAESRLELVRRLGIVRTPTTLLLDGSGRVRQRASGLPRREQVLAALAQLAGN